MSSPGRKEGAGEFQSVELRPEEVITLQLHIATMTMGGQKKAAVILHVEATDKVTHDHLTEAQDEERWRGWRGSPQQ